MYIVQRRFVLLVDRVLVESSHSDIHYTRTMLLQEQIGFALVVKRSVVSSCVSFMVRCVHIGSMIQKNG